jgi:hypothetical protein
VSGFSPAAGLKNGQFNRKRNEGIFGHWILFVFWDLLFVFFRVIQVRV